MEGGWIGGGRECGIVEGKDRVADHLPSFLNGIWFTTNNANRLGCTAKGNL